MIGMRRKARIRIDLQASQQSPNHPSRAGILTNLGVLLQRQGHLTKAEPYFREALVIMRRVLGAKHPNTISVVGNLAFLLREQGKYEEAEPLYRERLAVETERHGENAIALATPINSLAMLLHDNFCSRVSMRRFFSAWASLTASISTGIKL